MIIRPCTFDGCTVLTIGSRCVEHDLPVTRWLRPRLTVL